MDYQIHQVPKDCQSELPTAGDAIFPGSFNPLHRGHLNIAEFANRRFGRSVWFELSTTNAEKGTIPIHDLENRLNQDFGDHGLLTSQSAGFREKSFLFPGTHFVVGADTILRVADVAFYNGVVSEYLDAMSDIASNECRFIVFPRKVANKLMAGQNISLDDQILDLCSFVDPIDFQDDISSTKIREAE